MPSFKENLKNLDKLSYIFMLVNFLSWAPFEAIALYSKDLQLIALVTITGLLIFFLIIPAIYHPVLLRATLCLQIFIITALYMCAATFITWNRTPHIPILPDILYEYIPKGMDIHVPIIGDTTIVWMVDTTLYFVAGLTALLVFFQSDRLTIIKRFCLHYTVMQVMRTICLLVTNLPDCSDLCREITPGTQLMKDISLVEVVRKTWNVIMKPVHFVTCGDVMFSGHTTLLVSICLVWLTYFKPMNNKILNVIAVLVYVLVSGCIFGIIKSRFHYTLDVVVAIFLTLATWNLIHAFAYLGSHGYKMDREWIFGEYYILYFFNWLEKPERIMLHYKLPELPNPIQFIYHHIQDPHFYDHIFKKPLPRINLKSKIAKMIPNKEKKEK